MYNNRSAIYITLNQFDRCLENITLARKCNYPADRMKTLDEREMKCKLRMETLTPNPNDDPMIHFKLTYHANPKYPGIADCVELRNNQKHGNQLVTTRDLRPGDIIGVEAPSFTSASPDARFHRCSYCFGDNLMNLIACDGCTKAMFCSEKCRKTAMNEFHQFECNVHDNPELKITFTLRMLLKCINVFDGDVKALQSFVEKNKKHVTVFDFDFSNPEDPMYDKNMILVTLSVRNNAHYCKLMTSAMGGETRAFINHHPKLKEMWRQHAPFLNKMLEKLFIPTTFLTHMSVWFSKEVNVTTASALGQIQSMMMPNTRREKLREGNAGEGLYPAHCVSNGSCDPNVYVVSVGNKIAWIVSKPTPVGSELTHKYIEPFYNLGPAANRQNQFVSYFGYKCDCEACKNDWPRLDAMKPIDGKFEYRSINALSTPMQAKERIKKNIAYIEKNYVPNRPTKEVYTTIDYNLYEFSSLTKPAFYP